MKIGIISGSHRDPSQSAKVADYLQQQLVKAGAETWVFTLANNPLPLWDQKVWKDDEAWQAILTPLKKELSECEGFVIVSPEWHGQVPAGLKNFFLLFSRFELGHKPALITTVSSGDGGAYPVAAEPRGKVSLGLRVCDPGPPGPIRTLLGVPSWLEQC